MTRAALAFGLALLVGCTPAQTVVPTPTGAAAQPSASPSPDTTPSASPSAAPTALSVRVPGGIEATGLGTITGHWAFVTRMETNDQGFPGVEEIWAIPLDGGEPRRLARYLSKAGTRREAGNDLASQFSPDGRKLVLSVGQARADGRWRLGLVIVDIASGAVTPIGRDDQDHDLDPAWSPAGDAIAYVRVPDDAGMIGLDDGLWLVATDGTRPRRLVPNSRGWNTGFRAWSPDGRTIAFSRDFETAVLDFVDVSSGAVSTTQTEIGDGTIGWRTGSPAIALVEMSAPRAPVYRLSVASSAAAPFRAIAGPVSGVTLHKARWDPQGGALLYLRSGGGTAALHSIAADGTGDRAIPLSGHPMDADWTRDGARIVYLHRAIAQRVGGTAVRIMPRDGGAERELFVTTAPVHALIGITVRQY